MKRNVFVWLAFLLIALAVLRSAVATRLDGFTIDEAYHIAAGVSYVKYHDFRINSEHPPFVKLWVGSVMAATGFRLDSLRQFNNKPGERDYANLAVFRQNDPESVQRRTVQFRIFVGLPLGRSETSINSMTESFWWE